MTKAEAYEKILELLQRAELTARNGEWATCGTWAEQVRKFAWEAKEEVE